jgi:hypothetical protein
MGQCPFSLYPINTLPLERNGAGNNSFLDILDRVSVSCGFIWINFDDVQQPLHVPQGTDTPLLFSNMFLVRRSHEEKMPAYCV